MAHGRQRLARGQRGSWWQRWRAHRRGQRTRRAVAHALYCQVVNRARRSAFFARLGVPDTPEGRFEMVALHAALLIRRLNADGSPGRALAQELFDLMFADMDAGLRELGVGDLSVGKHVKRLARNFHARVVALDQMLDAGRSDRLDGMLATNVYHGGPSPHPDQLAALATYVVDLDHALAAQSSAALARGELVELVPLRPARLAPSSEPASSPVVAAPPRR
jgi:cytochrome b pre-mRNA-processing protein 3